jgi:threonylcarbamoyladenosine tRNA methylthiotransferase MtaB
MPKFKIITLGCKVNQAESEAMAGRLAAAHWTPAGSNEAADLCIVNTCAVTRRAGMQSRQAVRRAIQDHPSACVAVTGCYAQTDPQALLKIKGIGCLIDQKDKLRLPEALSAYSGAECSLWERLPASTASRQDAAPTKIAGPAASSLPPSLTPPPFPLPLTALSSLPSDLTAPSTLPPPLAAPSSFSPPLAKGAGGISPTAFSAPPPPGARTRPFLKIQDGCDAFCAYCIVPYARGSSRSAEFQAVLDGVSRLADEGFQEVVLTGIHLGAYGRDLEPRTGLADLLHAILQRPDPIRIRLSSIEPLELTDAIIDLAAGSERICRHFHVPLQSGDAQVLKRMRRPYSPERFGDRIARIHRRLPEAAIGTDVLVGFPGETEAAFETTYRLIEALPITYLHVFPFSPRPGTAAFAFGDRVPAELVRTRCSRLRQLGGRQRLAFHRRFIGRTLPVLTESRRDPQTGLLKGVSSNYLPVLFAGGNECMHRMVAVRIADADAARLRGCPAA